MTRTNMVTAARGRLGPVGVWLGALRTADAAAARYAAHRAEALGYGSLWIGEDIGGKEAFTQSAILLAATSTITVGIGIANVWTRHPAVMQGAAATVGSAWPDRFIVGMGIGHAPTVNASGMVYQKPRDHMSRYLADMDAASEHWPVPGSFPRLVGGLGPEMLAVARDQSDGACTFFSPPSHTPAARTVLGPDRLLIPEQAVVLSADATQARRIAREHMAFYLQFPNFTHSLRVLGYTEDDLSAGGSDHLVDALVAWGDESAIVRRVREHLDSGADHVLLQPLGSVDEAVGQLERLAPAVLQDSRG
jgi:probable F420-dependent oxidoreductase